MTIELKDHLQSIYENKKINRQLFRYRNLINKFENKFGKQDYKLFSSPGRTEISGNHTDHNNGKVIAASVDLDLISVASTNNNNMVTIVSLKYSKPFVINLNYTNIVNEEKGLTSGLIRGIAAGLVNAGYRIGGFNAFIASDISIGCGLSSSAAFEVLIGTIFNHLYNDGKINQITIAMIGKYSENNYYCKPCGLMDQITCAFGGVIEIDFSNPLNPLIRKINFDLYSVGYKLLVVDTEGNHSNLIEDYAAIPSEMKQVAAYFNKETCHDINFSQLLPEINSLRKIMSDRAILRTIHFLEENERVDKQVEALEQDNFDEFLSLVNESGNSSFKYLQNVFSIQNIEEQGVTLALALTETFIKRKRKGACRVHGGGFAGTIQVFLPEKLIKEYKNFITNVFNRKSVKVLSIRKHGAICLNNFS
jgi:galactokinase